MNHVIPLPRCDMNPGVVSPQHSHLTAFTYLVVYTYQLPTRTALTVTGLRVVRYGVQVPMRARDFSLLQNVHTGSVAHLASYRIGTGVTSGGQTGRDVKLPTHLHLVKPQSKNIN